MLALAVYSHATNHLTVQITYLLLLFFYLQSVERAEGQGSGLSGPPGTRPPFS